MRHITIRISEINGLVAIKNQLSKTRSLSKSNHQFLTNLFDQLVNSEELDMRLLNESIPIQVWDGKSLDQKLKKWADLFSMIPGYDYTGMPYIVQNEDINLLRENVLMTICFAPSATYNRLRDNGYEVRLKDNGTAYFWFPTFEDARQFPDLFLFNGTWKEAYYLLIETLKNGWPMEEFPEELRQFLKKE